MTICQRFRPIIGRVSAFKSKHKVSFYSSETIFSERNLHLSNRTSSENIKEYKEVYGLKLSIPERRIVLLYEPFNTYVSEIETKVLEEIDQSSYRDIVKKKRVEKIDWVLEQEVLTFFEFLTKRIYKECFRLILQRINSEKCSINVLTIIYHYLEFEVKNNFKKRQKRVYNIIDFCKLSLCVKLRQELNEHFKRKGLHDNGHEKAVLFCNFLQRLSIIDFFLIEEKKEETARDLYSKHIFSSKDI